LEGAGAVYKNGIGAFLKELPENQPFLIRLGLTQDWFVVFNANAGNLGRMPSELGTKIVTVYILMKKLIEEFHVNNEYLERLCEIEFKVREREGEMHLKESHAVVLIRLVEQAIRVKLAECELNIAVEHLFKLFDECGAH
jgi:hypothetical protein